MKIKLKREGGFMGIPANTAIDFEKLSEKEKKTLVNLLETGVIKPKSKKTTERGIGGPPDTYNYTVSMKKGTKTYSFKFNDTEVTDDLMEFFTKYLV